MIFCVKLPWLLFFCGVAAVVFIPTLETVLFLSFHHLRYRAPQSLTHPEKKKLTHDLLTCHVFTTTSSNTLGHCAHDIHRPHAQYFTLHTQIHYKRDKWTSLSCQSLSTLSIAHGALKKRLPSSSSLHQIQSWAEKRAEVLKVSRRSDHLYGSCAAKHRSPWELLLPTLQSLNKTLPWLYCSLSQRRAQFQTHAAEGSFACMA